MELRRKKSNNSSSFTRVLYIILIVVSLCSFSQEKKSNDKDRLLWKWRGGGLSTNVVADGDRVYITSDDELYCFGASDGKEIWKVKVEEIKEEEHEALGHKYKGRYCRLTLDNDKIFIAPTNGVYCHDSKTGKRLWGIKTEGYVGEATIAGNRVYFWNNDEESKKLKKVSEISSQKSKGEIYCIEKDSGKEIWKTKKYGGAHTPSRLAIIKNRLFGINDKGTIFCLDAVTGEEIWKKKVGVITFSSVAVNGEHVFVRFSANVSIWCLDAKSGEKIWKWKSDTIAQGEGSSLRYYDGRIYFGENDGRFFCLDAGKGKVLWKFNTKSTDFFAPDDDPVIAGNHVYFAHLSGQIFCVQVKDGKLIWKWKIPERIKSIAGIGVSSPAVSNGRVFFTIKNVLYALRDE